MTASSNPPVAIEAAGVDKVFKIWSHPSDILREVITGRSRHTEFNALTDVSMRVSKGSVVGILGQNGAGKSTLLRIIAGTLDPTRGKVSVDGKIAAILELGSGFHPDYTGRENIFLGGMCLGLSKADVRKNEQSIIEFAELEYAIDQPFRTYSSGMQARLTFAVAMSVKAEIIIIDEALSVGDARFQLKSFDRIKDMKRNNKTILFVSHSINQVNSICDEAILLDRGRLIDSGRASAVGNTYHQLLFEDKHSAAHSDGSVDRAPEESRDIEPASDPIDEEDMEIVTAVQQESSADATHLDIEPEKEALWDTDTIEEACFDPNAASQTVIENVSIEVSSEPAGQDEKLGSLTGEFSPTAHLGEELQDSSRPEIVKEGDREHRYGNGKARITSVSILDKSEMAVSQLRSLESYAIRIVVESQDDLGEICLGFLVRDARGMEIFGWDTRDGELDIKNESFKSPQLKKGSNFEARIGFRNNMAAGTYFLTAAIAEIDETKLDMRFDALEFSVHSTSELYHNSIVNLEIGKRINEKDLTSVWKRL